MLSHEVIITSKYDFIKIICIDCINLNSKMIRKCFYIFETWSKIIDFLTPDSLCNFNASSFWSFLDLLNPSCNWVLVHLSLFAFAIAVTIALAKHIESFFIVITDLLLFINFCYCQSSWTSWDCKRLNCYF